MHAPRRCGPRACRCGIERSATPSVERRPSATLRSTPAGSRRRQRSLRRRGFGRAEALRPVDATSPSTTGRCDRGDGEAVEPVGRRRGRAPARSRALPGAARVVAARPRPRRRERRRPRRAAPRRSRRDRTSAMRASTPSCPRRRTVTSEQADAQTTPAATEPTATSMCRRRAPPRRPAPGRRAKGATHQRQHEPTPGRAAGDHQQPSAKARRRIAVPAANARSRPSGIPASRSSGAQKKRARLSAGSSWKKSRQRPTLPHGFPCSTIGSEELNFRVRDGIGCGLLEITTGNFWIASSASARNEGCARISQSESRARSSNVCLRDMVKPHGLLVPVSSADCSASTPGLSTS